MRRLRDESGLTLIELQIALVLMLIVIGATLTTFNQSEASWRVNQEQTDALDQNRRAVDTISRQLRNLASPSTENPGAVERNQGDDLVFQTVAAVKPDGSENDRNITRVRYCLGNPSAGASTVWRQEQTWTSPTPPPAAPAGTACPDSGWPAIAGAGSNARAVARNVVNAATGEPLFTYDSTQPETIYSIGAALLVDVNPGKSPIASRLATTVFLRNQNQEPVASATAVDTGTGHRVVLNGSASVDPEGRSLALYEWFADDDLDDPIATGVVAQWVPAGAGWPQTHDITLRVTDAGGRVGETTIEGVTIN
jgi:type II secretory pathway pseudopilin PulG